MTDINLDMPEVTQEEKMTKDYSEETASRIEEARKIAKVRGVWVLSMRMFGCSPLTIRAINFRRCCAHEMVH